jgi:hypothetical protein
MPAPAPSVTLPYRFDTSRIWRLILTAMVALQAVIVAGLLYALLASRPLDVLVSLAASAAILAYFIWRFFRFHNGSMGIITADRVVVRRGTLLGLDLPGPSGDFAIDRFSAVRVEMMMGPAGLHDAMQGGPHERIWLVGRDGAPDVLVARTQFEAGRTLGGELGAALRLPVQETHEPY